jgi:hypothetical protein
MITSFDFRKAMPADGLEGLYFSKLSTRGRGDIL